MANKQIQIEDITMGEVLKSMHRLGGSVTRKEIRQDIRDNSDIIPEKKVDEVKVSKKTGKKYSPFTYTLNFAVKYLIMTEYIKTADNKFLELTEKGIKVDMPTFNGAKDVRPLVEHNDTIQKKQS